MSLRAAARAEALAHLHAQGAVGAVDVDPGDRGDLYVGLRDLSRPIALRTLARRLERSLPVAGRASRG